MERPREEKLYPSTEFPSNMPNNFLWLLTSMVPTQRLWFYSGKMFSEIHSSAQILSIDYVKWNQDSNFSYRPVCPRVYGILHAFSVLL